jgi:sugar lactone lactonase YvrE
MFYADSANRTIDAFDFDPESGRIANRRAGFEVSAKMGAADGMTIDVDGNLWVAFWGGWCVAQIDPVDGRVCQKIELPVSNVSSCTFGGNQLDELYITTATQHLSVADLALQPHAGDLFVARTNSHGRPPHRYR